METMSLEVRLFAVARELADCERLSINLPADSTVADLREQLLEQVPGLAPLAQQLVFAVDEQYTSDDTVLQPGVDVACIPPVSGG